MARKRMIDPAIWTDQKTMQLSNESFIVFIGLISQADDEGIIEIEASSLFFRLARRQISQDQLEECLNEINSLKLIEKYDTYAFLPNWYKHQNLNRPTQTKLRRPPANIVKKYPEYIEKWEKAFSEKGKPPTEYPFRESSLRTHGVFNEDSVSTHEQLTEDSMRTHAQGKGREGKGKEGKGIEGEVNEDSVSTHAGSSSGEEPAEPVAEGVEQLSKWRKSHGDHPARASPAEDPPIPGFDDEPA